MSTIPILRPATNADRQAVEDLVFSVLREFGLRHDPGGTDADLRDIVANYQGGIFDVLEDPNGAIVGSVGLFRVDGETCELRKMYLRPAVRGSGQGRRLLEHALAEARRLGYRRVTLETASPLTAAIALYRRYDFRPVAREHQAARCDQSFVLDF
jgi:putative acetyltransferase